MHGDFEKVDSILAFDLDWDGKDDREGDGDGQAVLMQGDADEDNGDRDDDLGSELDCNRVGDRVADFDEQV